MIGLADPGAEGELLHLPSLVRPRFRLRTRRERERDRVVPLDGVTPPHVDVEDDEDVVDDGFELAPLLRQIALLPRLLLRRLLGETPGEGLCLPLSTAVHVLELRRGPRPSVFGDEPLPSVLARQAG